MTRRAESEPDTGLDATATAPRVQSGLGRLDRSVINHAVGNRCCHIGADRKATTRWADWIDGDSSFGARVLSDDVVGRHNDARN